MIRLRKLLLVRRVDGQTVLFLAGTWRTRPQAAT
jgi:hypothetical protein